jgi:uncharacterized protein
VRGGLTRRRWSTCLVSERSTNSQTATKGEGLTYFALLYDVVDGFVERRAPYREAHLRLAQEARDRGELLLAGALGMPPDHALLIFRSNDSSTAAAFARDDPYVVNGLVTHWEVQPWAVVIGNELGMASPIVGTE